MNATTTLQRALAAQVALPLTPLPETAAHCPAWIESKGAECKRPATDGLLCRRHHNVAERRLAAAIEKRQAEAVKARERLRPDAPASPKSRSGSPSFSPVCPTRTPRTWRRMGVR